MFKLLESLFYLLAIVVLIPPALLTIVGILRLRAFNKANACYSVRGRNFKPRKAGR